MQYETTNTWSFSPPSGAFLTAGFAKQWSLFWRWGKDGGKLGTAVFTNTLVLHVFLCVHVRTRDR